MFEVIKNAKLQYSEHWRNIINEIYGSDRCSKIAKFDRYNFLVELSSKRFSNQDISKYLSSSNYMLRKHCNFLYSISIFHQIIFNEINLSSLVFSSCSKRIGLLRWASRFDSLNSIRKLITNVNLEKRCFTFVFAD